MPNLIQIKRSLTTASVPSLANGEFAFTSNGDVLSIGANGTIVHIAGKRVPGTLTANQAIVTNSTSYVDVIKTANLYIGSFTVNTINAVSNSTVLGAAANNELPTTWSAKNYVDSKLAGFTASPGGANTQIQFNDSASLGGSAGLTFNKSSNNLSVANTISAANGSFTDVFVSGNLNVTGTLTTIDATNLSVNDSIITLARNNSGTSLDIGFFGQYNDGSNRYAGFVWDASAGVYELFANTTVIPTTTVDTAGTGYVRATLRAYLNTGALVSNSTVINITANSTVSSAIAANTLTLSTALGGTSGGTGLNTYTTQDILVANTTNGFNKLSLAADGLLLQSNGTALIYSSIDAGTF